MNWIQRFLTAIATHKADAAAHHHVPLWDEIGDHVVTGAEASISFASIPSGYSVLLLMWDNLKGDDTSSKLFTVTFNDDVTALNYNYVGANGTIRAIAKIADSDASDYRASGHIFITNTVGHITTYQGIEFSTTNIGTTVLQNVIEQSWETTDEITKVTLTPTGGNFDAGRVILLGLKT